MPDIVTVSGSPASPSRSQHLLRGLSEALGQRLVNAVGLLVQTLDDNEALERLRGSAVADAEYAVAQ